MNIVFDHVFGLQGAAEVYHSTVSLESVDPVQYDQVLAQGWLADSVGCQPEWYQCRSTRCAVADTDYTVTVSMQQLHELLVTDMDRIHGAYCQHKNYVKLPELEDYLPTDLFFGYHDAAGQMVAWSKLRPYSRNSIETVFFGWNYAEPKTRLGINSLTSEIAWAKACGYQYVYLGPGYETMNIYKSKIQGFEWWTGREWSQDVDQYVALCKRDSAIRRCVDLHDLGIRP